MKEKTEDIKKEAAEGQEIFRRRTVAEKTPKNLQKGKKNVLGVKVGEYDVCTAQKELAQQSHWFSTVGQGCCCCHNVDVIADCGLLL